MVEGGWSNGTMRQEVHILLRAKRGNPYKKNLKKPFFGNFRIGMLPPASDPKGRLRDNASNFSSNEV